MNEDWDEMTVAARIVFIMLLYFSSAAVMVFALRLFFIWLVGGGL
jgi:hypothetical protein